MSQRAAQKAESRGAILRAGSLLLRGKGISGMSVERVMAGARLTVGAFYAHFSSKDELLDASFDVALDENGAVMLEQLAGRTGHGALLDFVNYYLGEEHRDRPAKGCPMPAVSASALPLGGRSLHKLVARGLETLSGRFFGVGAGAVSRDRALALTALMIGGQILARATRGSSLSSDVLRACRVAAGALLHNDRQ